MQKRLVPVGNSLALIIDKPILELLHVDRDTPVELRVEGEKLIIGAATKQQRKKRIKDIAKRVFDEHASTMAKLAK
jgi:antitoxin component of MazEF toxin-antitoxin module